MTPEVELDGVTFERDGQRILNDISLRVMPGERIALFGANGTGKTTLLRLIAGLVRPLSGTVRLSGRICRNEADFRRARAAIGFLFQDSDDQLFSPTVAEDIAFGPLNLGVPRAEAFTRAEGQLADFGLSHLAGRPVHRLSGGEKRLVCLAGLFVMRPHILLLDEPTNGLDDDARLRLTSELQGFPGAMIIVTHDPLLVDELDASRISLREGRLIGSVANFCG